MHDIGEYITWWTSTRKLNKQLKNDMNRDLAIPYFKSEWGMAYI